ncbi:MAG TPA: hypothetical protein VF175_16390, partial [Lacipirellula sp.]
LSGVLDYTGPTTVADGTLRLSAEFNTPGAGVTIGPQGVLEVGGGTVARDIDNAGLVRSPTFAGQGLRITGEAAGGGNYFGNVAFAHRYSPGDGAAAVMMTNTVLESTNTLEMELAGPTPGSQHDHLALSGRLTAGGRLVVSLVDGFTPQPGDVFNLFDWSTFSGSFVAITLPELAGAVWDTSRLYADGTLSVLAAADFNADGLVDAADLAAWTAGAGMIGSATHARGDADSDQDVDGADFLAWQRQIGAGGTVASVPEPQSGAGLAGMAAGMFAGQLRKRRPAMPTAESSSCRVPLHSVMTSRFMQALSHIAGNVQR